MPSDLEIAQQAEVKPIAEIATAMGLAEEDVDLYRKFKAKISHNVLNKFADKPNGKYVVVTSMTPTPLGEGKTTTTVGLGMALNRLGHRAAICLRQSSLGPVFGVKGGATGSGLAQVLPMEDINLHLTGDIHAVSAANNPSATPGRTCVGMPSVPIQIRRRASSAPACISSRRLLVPPRTALI